VSKLFDMIEPEARNHVTGSGWDALLVSIAISTKRIADFLDSRAEPVDHVQAMADAASLTQGTMILDVLTLPDGTQHSHAVATWEDADEGGTIAD
jgi:hypothetical protein